MGKQIWRFRIRESCSDNFIKMNTCDWPTFFGRSSEYKGTTIGRNVDDPRIFATIDEWTSKSAFEEYIEANRQEYDKLNTRHQQLYESVRDVGFYDF